ncbi:DNA cytosine methyltransferase [uncultured Variovorax sp.]|uniref:DNA cytosine methyltransferase n=1 Tax=uncultured Variovorax sp. TaxID=114708 RepID=UPI0025D4FBD5|nr:DNA cytosine methyltransferase [uncultured Variovorax sp.]
MIAYYNEFDPKAAAWLRELIKHGHIAPGVVDERSIEDVVPDELVGYTQCHFFAGIGVWSYALRRAGWPDDRQVWTASCPCQPFSQEGEGAGFADERHLWPHLYHLIGQRRPGIIIGEQVASKDTNPWVDLVHTDLEALDYAFGAIAFPSAGIGAPHIRDRVYWVGNADHARLEGHAGDVGPAGWRAATGPVAAAGLSGDRDTANSPWRDADWLLCRDGKWRPVEPGTFPLAHGAPARVGRLRGYGNAINAEAAKAFIEAVMEVA